MKTFNYAALAKMQRKVAVSVAQEEIALKGKYRLVSDNGTTVETGTFSSKVPRKDLTNPLHGKKTFHIKTEGMEVSEYEDTFEVLFSHFHLILEVGYDFKGNLEVEW